MFDPGSAALRVDEVRSMPLACLAPVIALLEADGWARDIPSVPSPTFHLEVVVIHGDETFTVRWHITDGRPALTRCSAQPCPITELEGSIAVPALRLLDVFDPEIPDPLLGILSPPADARMSFDGLLFVGGLIDTWVRALRRAAPPIDLDAIRLELAGGR